MRPHWFLVLILAAPTVGALSCSVAPPAEASNPIALDAKSVLLKGDNYLEYRIGGTIQAPPQVVWEILTDAAGFPKWNSTVISIDGDIALDQKIVLKAHIDPEREFPLMVSTFEPPSKMVWEDGGDSFRGVRTFLLDDVDGATKFTMAEVLSGYLMPMIEGSLPDFRPDFDAYFADLKQEAEKRAAPKAPPPEPPPAAAVAEPSNAADGDDAASSADAGPPEGGGW